MPRPPTGSVIVRRGPMGVVYALRYRINGYRYYETLGSEENGWNQERAEVERERALREVKQGIRQAPRRKQFTEKKAREPTTADAYSLLRRSQQALDRSYSKAPGGELRSYLGEAQSAGYAMEDAIKQVIALGG